MTGLLVERAILSNAEGSTGLPYLTTSNLGKTVNNQTPLLAFSCKDHGADAGRLAPTIRSMEFDRSHANAGGQVAVAFSVSDHGADARPGLAPPHRAMHARSVGTVAVAFDSTQITHPANRSNPRPGDPAPAFPARGHAPVVAFKPQDPALLDETVVRRITPREVERLFGLPDDWTLIEHGHARRDPVELAAQALYLSESGYSEADAWALADVPDGPRYRTLGNTLALPVIAWILGRIRLAEEGAL